jgi:hypothetical protein
LVFYKEYKEKAGCVGDEVFPCSCSSDVDDLVSFIVFLESFLSVVVIIWMF